MANQYHDELGRFCSKNEMGSAVERLSDLMTSAPTQDARSEAAAQWFTLKGEYDALAKPNYARQLEELDARIFSTSSKSVRRQLDAERAELQLKADASDEGFNELLRKNLAQPRDSAFRFADDYRIERAAVYRTQSDTAEAIESYKLGTAPRYESTIELFRDTNAKVLRTNQRVYIAEQGASGYEIQHNFPLDDANFDTQILSLRQQVGDRLADQAKYSKNKLNQDLYSGDLNAVYFGAVDNAAHIVRSDSSEVVAEAEFNENGAFIKATVAHSSGDGSVVTLDTSAQFRSFLRNAKEQEGAVKSLPAWKTGREEKLPAFAAPASNDMEELDVLF